MSPTEKPGMFTRWIRSSHGKCKGRGLKDTAEGGGSLTEHNTEGGGEEGRERTNENRDPHPFLLPDGLGYNTRRRPCLDLRPAAGQTHSPLCSSRARIFGGGGHHHSISAFPAAGLDDVTELWAMGGQKGWVVFLESLPKS